MDRHRFSSDAPLIIEKSKDYFAWLSALYSESIKQCYTDETRNNIKSISARKPYLSNW